MRRKRIWLLSISALLILVLNLLVLSGCSPQEVKEKPHVTIGIQVSPAMTLVMVAKDKGCFDEEGLDVELKGFTSNRDSIKKSLTWLSEVERGLYLD